MPAPYTISAPSQPDSDVLLGLAGPITLPLLEQCCRHAAERVLLEMKQPWWARHRTTMLMGHYAALSAVADLLADLVRSGLNAADVVAPRALRLVQAAETYLWRLERGSEGN